MTFEALLQFLFGEWWISVPMLITSILTVAVIFERALFLNRNRRDIDKFVERAGRELETGNMNSAQGLAENMGGVLGDVAQEGIRLLGVNRKGFETAFDITIGLGLRKLDKNLAVLGTIGAVTPFLGLLGTVVGILRSFQTFSQVGGAKSSQLATEIGFALIATAAGLVIAILAVVAYNILLGIVAKFEDDMQLLKLLFLSFTESGMPTRMPAGKSSSYSPSTEQPYQGY
jgi:biopolymer transport protein ExbB